MKKKKRAIIDEHQQSVGLVLSHPYLQTYYILHVLKLTRL